MDFCVWLSPSETQTQSHVLCWLCSLVSHCFSQSVQLFQLSMQEILGLTNNSLWTQSTVFIAVKKFFFVCVCFCLCFCIPLFCSLLIKSWSSHCLFLSWTFEFSLFDLFQSSLGAGAYPGTSSLYNDHCRAGAGLRKLIQRSTNWGWAGLGAQICWNLRTAVFNNYSLWRRQKLNQWPIH